MPQQDTLRSPAGSIKRRQIAEAIEAYLADHDREPLAALSANTEIDGVEIVDLGLREIGNGQFEADFIVYVALSYGRDDDHFTTSDNFPGKAVGTWEAERPRIDAVTVDTRSFYE